MRSPIVWYQKPGYVVISGRFSMPDPAGWLKNSLVLRYAFFSHKGETSLVLELVPGAQTNVACDLLPSGPFAASRVDLTYTKPQIQGEWREVSR